MHPSAVAQSARSRVLTKPHRGRNVAFIPFGCLVARGGTGWRSQATSSSAAAASTEPPAALGDHAAIRPISAQPRSLQSAGFVVREADHSLIPDEFHELLNSIVCSYQAACGDRLVGVYLRGSIPRSLFIPGISDVDTFGILLPIATEDNSSTSGSSSSEGDVSSAASLQDMQGAVRRLCEPAIQAHQHLGYTKVELKLLEVQPGSTAAAALELILNSHTNTATSKSSSSSSSSSRSRSESSASDGAGHAYTLRPSMCAAIPYAFEIKVASVVLSGLDLPQLLPPNAALPPHYEVLPGLVDGVEDARLAVKEAAAAAAAGPAAQLSKETGTAAPSAAVAQDMEVQVRATKWVLKRLLRAAFELVQDRAGVYTRDLFWCCHEAKQYLPQLQQQLSWGPAQQPLQQQQQEQQQLQELQQYWQQQLDSVLQHYIDLQATLMQLQNQQHQSQRMPQGNTAATQGTQERLQQLVQGGWQLADSLLPKLEALFLKAMLVEEPGWLTHHLGHPIPASVDPNSTSGSGDSSFDAASSRGSFSAAATADSPATDSLQSVSQLQQLQRQEAPVQSPWLFAGKALQALHGLLTPAASAAAAAGAIKPSSSAGPGNAASTAVTRTSATHVQQLMGAVPPAVQVPVVGQVTAFDWHEQTGAAAAAVRDILLQQSSPVATARSLKPQLTPSAAGPAAAADYELLGSWPQPVVLRGAAAAWPCVSQPWCLDWLGQQQDFTGKVRVAPSLQFPFVEPQLLDVLLKLRGRQAAPSLLVDMAAQEFVQRMQPGCTLPAVAYPHSEYYYWQADLPEHLQQQQQLSQLLDALARDMGEQQPRHEWLALTQQPRLWVSPAGAVSPLHYDKSHSFLAQVAGVKRMLFFSRDQLHRLYCYPDTHLLRRRSRVNLVSPDLVRFPLFSDVAALEVVLEPGDVCVFPSDWPHYTESLGYKPEAGSDLHQAAGCSMSITFRCRPVGRAP